MSADLTIMNDSELSEYIRELEAIDILSKNKTVNLGQAAMWYVRYLGWPVFPLKPGTKQPLTSHGFKDASTDPAQIEAWWVKYPEANIGVPTGERVRGGCGFDVIDIDGIQGFASLRVLQHSNCRPDCCKESFCPELGGTKESTALCFTPGDPAGKVRRDPGRHYYVPASGASNRASIMDGIDLRGTGGYVVVPPSIGLSGTRYSWITQPTPEG